MRFWDTSSSFHPMRASDALQLAAALVAAQGDPTSLNFVCFDTRLNDAARREGLDIPVDL